MDISGSTSNREQGVESVPTKSKEGEKPMSKMVILNANKELDKK